MTTFDVSDYNRWITQQTRDNNSSTNYTCPGISMYTKLNSESKSEFHQYMSKVLKLARSYKSDIDSYHIYSCLMFDAYSYGPNISKLTVRCLFQLWNILSRNPRPRVAIYMLRDRSAEGFRSNYSSQLESTIWNESRGERSVLLQRERLLRGNVLGSVQDVLGIDKIDINTTKFNSSTRYYYSLTSLSNGLES